MAAKKAAAEPTPTVDLAAELAALKAELEAAKQAPRAAAPLPPAPRNPAPPPQQQQQFRPNKMNNIILGSLLKDQWGNLKGSFEFDKVKEAVMTALADTKVEGRIRFQVLRRKTDGSPFLTVGGVGEFGGGGGGQRSQPQGRNYDSHADNRGYDVDTTGADEWT